MSDTYALIVGAGPGLGLAIARRFGAEFGRVALFARSLENLGSLGKTLDGEGIETLVRSVDAADLPALDATTREVISAWGAPEAVIYHGAAAAPNRPLDLPPTQFARELTVNVVGAQLIASVAAKSMPKGTILFTGGGFAMYPNADMASLSAGKAALKNLTESAAPDLAERGIHLTVINICGYVEPTGRFSTQAIAEKYWEIHTQAREDWAFEFNYV